MSRSVACVDYRNGKILIARRKDGGDMGNRWEFPGGKIEEGEDFITAIKREMMEEFGCGVQVFDKIADAEFKHHAQNCSVFAFRVKMENDGIENPFILTEHTEYKWIKPDEIKDLSFVDSDMALFPQIKKALGI